MENLFDTLDEKEQLRISKQVIKELQNGNKELLDAIRYVWNDIESWSMIHPDSQEKLVKAMRKAIQ